MDFESNLIERILTFIFGAGGLWAFFSTRKKEKILAQKEQALTEKEKAMTFKTDAETFKIMQEAYNEFAKEMRFEIGQQKQEISMLQSIIKDMNKKCAVCVNNKPSYKPIKKKN